MDANSNVIITSFLPIFIAALAIYFLIIKPEKKAKAQLNRIHEGLELNQEVVTTGGIVGTIVKLQDDTVVLESYEKTRIRVLRSAIASKKETSEVVNK